MLLNAERKPLINLRFEIEEEDLHVKGRRQGDGAQRTVPTGRTRRCRVGVESCRPATLCLSSIDKVDATCPCLSDFSTAPADFVQTFLLSTNR